MASIIRPSMPECGHQLVQKLERGSDKDRPRYNRLRAGTKRLKRTPLKRMSKGLKAETLKYHKVSTEFLLRPENKWCICCTLRREKLGENILQNPATEIHHWAGRIKRLLCYVPYFRPFCFWCRLWPHEHPEQARKLNLLAPSNLWNVFLK